MAVQVIQRETPPEETTSIAPETNVTPPQETPVAQNETTVNEAMDPTEVAQAMAARAEHARTAVETRGAEAMTAHPQDAAAIKQLTIETKGWMRSALTKHTNRLLGAEVKGTEGLDDQKSREIAWAWVQQSGGAEAVRRMGGLKEFEYEGKKVDLNDPKNVHLAKLLESRGEELARAEQHSGGPNIVKKAQETPNLYRNWEKSGGSSAEVVKELKTLQEQNTELKNEVQAVRDELAAFKNDQERLIREAVQQALQEAKEVDTQTEVKQKQEEIRNKWAQQASTTAQTLYEIPIEPDEKAEEKEKPVPEPTKPTTPPISSNGRGPNGVGPGAEKKAQPEAVEIKELAESEVTGTQERINTYMDFTKQMVNRYPEDVEQEGDTSLDGFTVENAMQAIEEDVEYMLKHPKSPLARERYNYIYHNSEDFFNETEDIKGLDNPDERRDKLRNLAKRVARFSYDYQKQFNRLAAIPQEA